MTCPQTTAGALRRAMLAVMMLAAVPQTTTAQISTVRHPGELEWTVAGAWRQGQGLPHDRVISLHQARDGYLWVGTRGGAARFDGLTFTVWTGREPSAPPEGEIYSFAEAADGALWIAVNGGGLGRYHLGAFRTLTAADGLVDDLVRVLAVDGHGTLWVGTDRGLSRYAGGVFTNFTTRDGLADAGVRSLAIDAAGAVLVGSRAGLQRFDGSRFSAVPLLPGGEPVQVDALTHDRAGRLWAGTSHGLLLVSPGGAVAFGPAHGLSSRAVQTVREDADGRLWVGTSNGLDHSIGEPGAHMRFTSVLSGVDVTTVGQDNEGGIWVGFRGYGLVRLQRALFRVWDPAAGLPSKTATAVFEMSDGTIWAASGTALVAMSDRRMVSFAAASGLPDRAISSLAEDRSGRLWVGTEAGLYRSAGPASPWASRFPTRFEPIGRHAGLRTHVRVMCPEADGAMVVGTNANGVVRVHPNGVETVPPGASTGDVRALVCGGADGLWIGTRGSGLLHLRDDGVTRYTTREGLADDNVQALLRDPDGVLWIATRRGLSRLAHGRLASIRALDGLHENYIYGITADATGRLWMASGRGVFAVRRDDLHAVADGRVPRVSAEVFGLEHGLPSTQCALSHHPVAMTSRDGRVWFATLGGVVEADPSTVRAVVLTLPVRIEGVTVNDRTYTTVAPLDAPQGRGTLVFRYTAPSFTGAGEIEFRYRLEGSDPGWVAAGKSREARYTNIRPGRYRFVVSARPRDGDWSATGAAVDVTLRPHVYQTVWFLTLAVVVALGLVSGSAYAAHRGRIRRLQARERELAARVDRALADLKVLHGLLPICAWCKKIRDDQGYWTQMEAYIKDHSEAVFSHGMCPDCLREHYADAAADQDERPR